MQILADTNVLLRLADPSHAQYQSADRATELLRNQGHVLVMVPQNLFEFWAVATRPAAQNGMGIVGNEAFDLLTNFRRLFRLLRDERTIVDFWQSLVVTYEVKGKQAHDARLVAAMQRHSITHLLTFNGADFVRFPFVTALNPAELTNGLAEN